MAVQICSSLNTYQVTSSHTAQNISLELMNVTDMWNITSKVVCVVTDNASNMTAAVKLTPWLHLPCFAHTLNLIVQSSLSSYSSELVNLRQKCRNIVTYFKRIVQANREKLKEAYRESGKEEKNLYKK